MSKHKRCLMGVRSFWGSFSGATTLVPGTVPLDIYSCTSGLPLVAQIIKSLPAIQETQVWSLSKENPLEKEMATHSSILAWEIPWTKEPGSLSYMELHRELDTTKQLTLSLSCISMVLLFTKVLQSLFLIIIAMFSSRSCHAHFQMRKSSLDPK